MENEIINTKLHENRVSSTYAEIYLDDDYCDDKYFSSEVEKSEEIPLQRRSLHKSAGLIYDDWISPSDLLIGIVDLKPPFTSKINRGKTHKGILHIGNTVLEQERAGFLKSLSNLVQQNDSSWQHIFVHEKEAVIKKVKQIYENIFEQKRQVMTEEISKFYEENLQELEEHLKSEIHTVLKSTHANIISTLNNDIKMKLKLEKKKLEDVLRKRLLSEVKKVNSYYSLLFRNEVSRNEDVISHALHERNHAIRAFLKQAEAEKFTTSMYIMSLEHKKCKIKKMLLKSHHNKEVLEKIKVFKEKKEIIQNFKEKEVTFSQVNKEWEEKIEKVLKLFLKFISFSLKLLPEQATFLLDLEKMAVLQLNEIQKDPIHAPKLLVDEEDLANIFNFEQCAQSEKLCDKNPFVLIGDLSDPVPPRYGSTETLPSDVDLPIIRLQRQFKYAKCHGYEEIKRLLKSQTCKCGKIPSNTPSTTQTTCTDSTPIEEIPVPALNVESSEELLLCENFRRLPDCPALRCKEVIRKNSFPFLPLYLDYTEDNYNRVTAILGKTPERKISPEMIQPKEVVYKELPFAVTKERYHTVETQYSSQETIKPEPEAEYTCTCKDNEIAREMDLHFNLKASTSDIDDILRRRKISLQRLMNQRPSLLKLFTDECYDVKV